MKTDILILGGGIAGLSLASFLDRKSVVLERESAVGGLSRSYKLNDVAYDIGPHIIFSKNTEVLDLHTSIIKTNKIRRSNQISFKGRYVKYPFENDLSALDKADRDYCLAEFLHNPYENYAAGNMLQFFLRTFGEGITRLYLAPYNEKIWKFDPSCLDTQMVERIPKPPREDVIASANGVATEGYTHQLYFHYPEAGGFQTLVDAYKDSAQAKGQQIETSAEVRRLEATDEGWTVHLDDRSFQAKQLINCMPLHELFKYLEPPAEIKQSLDRMLYNSIHIVVVQVKKDRIGDHFALYVPDKDILFHRLSKLNFLGDSYVPGSGGSALMAEVTFRPDSYLSTLSKDAITEEVISGLVKLGYIDREDVVDVAVRTERYAYVIYDLDHRKNTDRVLGWLKAQGIRCSGRFAEFEYLNTDGVVERTLALARELNQQATEQDA